MVINSTIVSKRGGGNEGATVQLKPAAPGTRHPQSPRDDRGCSPSSSTAVWGLPVCLDSSDFQSWERLHLPASARCIMSVVTQGLSELGNVPALQQARQRASTDRDPRCPCSLLSDWSRGAACKSCTGQSLMCGFGFADTVLPLW